MRQENSNRNAKLMVIVAVLMLSAVLFASSALAIGITPSKRQVNFASGQKLTYGIDIINNGHENLEVVLYPRGEFAENVKLSTQMLELGSDDESKRVNVDFTMPQKIDVAGPHTVEIVAVGSKNMPAGKGAMVKADIAVISKLIIDVPYPDKYAEARIHVYDTEVGRPVMISVPVFNKGSKQLDNVNVKIKIFSSDGTLVDQIVSDTRSLAPGSSTKFAVHATKEYFKGSYKAVATVSYDGQQLEVETEFSIGELTIDIKNLVVNEFSLGDVAKFDIILHNTWSDTLKNVYADMEITGDDNTVYAEFKTVAIDIPSRGIGTLEGYWYTQGIEPGIYTAKVTLHYANKISQKEFELEVYANKIVTRGMKTGKAIEAPEELKLEKNAFLVLIIIVLAAVTFALVMKLRKKNKLNLPQTPKSEEKRPQAEPDQKPDQKSEEAKTSTISPEQIEQLQKELDELKKQARLEGDTADSKQY